MELISASLGRIVDWSSNFLPANEVVVLREAEGKAKEHHQRIWRDWVEVLVDNDTVGSYGVRGDSRSGFAGSERRSVNSDLVGKGPERGVLAAPSGVIKRAFPAFGECEAVSGGVSARMGGED